MHEGFPREGKTLFARGLMFPIEEGSSWGLVQEAVGSERYLSLLGTALHSERVVSFCVSAAPVHEGVVGSSSFTCPPLRPPRVCISWRMIDTIVGRVVGKSKNRTTIR